MRLNCKDLEINNKIFKTNNLGNIEFMKFDNLKIDDIIRININEKELNKEGSINIEQIELIENKK